ncbi:hypothetical protein B0H11DRAFT_1162017 [Mycena galericulata]|nr:hypothetical protein B0H11DRAFT_1162017 [Mycena galericulata]
MAVPIVCQIGASPLLSPNPCCFYFHFHSHFHFGAGAMLSHCSTLLLGSLLTTFPCFIFIFIFIPSSCSVRTSFSCNPY